MNISTNFPEYLTPVEAFSGAMEVVGEVREKTDREGVRKVSAWNGLVGWVLPLEYIHGTKEKTLPTGQTVESVNLVQVNVTIWGAQPRVKMGDYVQLENPAIGAVDGNIFVQALGVKAYDSDADISAVLGDSDD